MFDGVSKELVKKVVIFIDKRGNWYNQNLAKIHKETDKNKEKKFKYSYDILLRLVDKRDSRQSTQGGSQKKEGKSDPDNLGVDEPLDDEQEDIPEENAEQPKKSEY